MSSTEAREFRLSRIGKPENYQSSQWTAPGLAPLAATQIGVALTAEAGETRTVYWPTSPHEPDPLVHLHQSPNGWLMRDRRRVADGSDKAGNG